MTVTDRVHDEPTGAGAIGDGAASHGAVSGDADAGVVLEWSELPANVRTAVIAIAARALGTVPADQVPTALAPIARFTPGKRARVGAGPLARALDQDAGFRAMVAQHLPPEPVGAQRGTGAADADPKAADDPVDAAARAFLLRLPGARDTLEPARRADEIATLRTQVTELTASVEKLSAQLARATGRGKAATGQHRRRSGDPGNQGGDEAGEAARLRQRLRDQGSRVKEAERAAHQAVTAAEAERDEAQALAAREHASAENWRARAEQEAHRAERSRQALERLREESGQQRADTDRRIELLLGTVEQAAVGLRREWQLAAGGADPADVATRHLPEVDPPTRRSADPALLLDWLGLPHAHLIVDGYNVTKTGYPDLSLADQRDRLSRSLAALAARTGAEITAVFDGAAVVAAAPVVRGVRVVFSPPGVIADDVIRRLAAAEPAGRVVVVVSSDREVADGVRRSGARTAPSPVLLSVLG